MLSGIAGRGTRLPVMGDAGASRVLALWPAAMLVIQVVGLGGLHLRTRSLGWGGV